MDYLYFRTEWFVSQPKKEGCKMFGALVSVANITSRRSDCFMAIENFKHWKTRGDGCHIIPFMWRVSSQETFEKYLDEISDYMVFTEIQSITLEEFEAEEHDPFMLTMCQELSINAAVHFNELAAKNAQIITHTKLQK